MLKKKSLGQHFLKDPRILQKIAQAAELSSADTVLEVGPGEGTLTVELLKQAGKVIAVEKDDRLIPMLNQTFASEIASGKLKLVHGDILTLPKESLLSNLESVSTTPPRSSPSKGEEAEGGYKIVANLPYYITGQFLRLFLEGNPKKPTAMVLLLQKEVARRIVASDDKESLLSISIKAYGKPRYIDTVKAGSFSSPPQVDSAIIAIEEISSDFFNTFKESDFFEVLKKGFAHPRKLLSSNIGVPKEALAPAGIPEKARAEDLRLEDWRKLMVQQGYKTLGPNSQEADLRKQ